MKLSFTSWCLATFTVFTSGISSQSIAALNGNKYVSSYRNQDVSNVTGLITAKGPSGFWIRSNLPDNDPKTSESLYIFDNKTVSGNLTTGDIVTLNGRFVEYRSASNQIFLAELTRPTNVKVVSRGNQVKPKVIGKDTLSPPTDLYSSLDNGDVFGVPNNSSQITRANPELDPIKYGLDFWESIMGELVTVKKPKAVSKPNQFGDTWVVGDWKKTGQNSRGGLTITSGANGNPEAIIIGDPLDGSDNPQDTKLGDSLDDITGVVYQSFGTYRILPLKALKVLSSAKPALPRAADFKSSGKCKSLTFGDYNIENFAPNSTGVEGRAEHIVKYLGSPDVVFLQEIQDDTGPTNDGAVSANKSLDVLINAIAAISPLKYSYVDIDPVNNQDGGQPGGNIRQAYLYNPAVVEIANPKPGSPTDATEVLSGPSLSFNPGRIEPNSSAWRASRKPLAAQWRVRSDNSTFFTINVHFTSKGGGSPIEGDLRPPVNGGIEERTAQANITAAFVADILAEDPSAAVIVAGDFNEFTYVQPLKVFLQESGLVDLDEAAKIDPVERYTYLFDMNSQQLDHFFISKSIAEQKPKLEHVHVNTWVSFADQISDHDPSVALLNVCGSRGGPKKGTR